MNRLFRWGVIISLFVLIASALWIARTIFVSDDSVVDVPSVIGMTAVDAAARLKEHGFMSRIDFVESEQPEGIVVSQRPNVGEKADKSRIISIRASKGGALVKVPDVRGLEFAVAVRELDTAGLKTGTVLRVPEPTKPSGTVIAQNPAAPAMMPNDRMVELLVSEGGQGTSEMVLVPDLRGQTESLARQILEQSSLSVARVMRIDSNQVPEGTIVRTQPIAGSRVPNGNGITIYLAQTPAEPVQQVPVQVAQTPPNAVTPTSHNTANAVTPRQDQNSVSAPAQQIPAAPQQNAIAPTPVTAPVSDQRQPDQQIATTPSAPPATPTKTAKIRYQVPPLARPLHLKISITDERGTRVLRDQQANGGEYITMDIGYTGSAGVTVQLGSETVWRENYR